MKRGIILSVFILAIALSSGFAMGQSVVKETKIAKDLHESQFWRGW